MNLHGEMVRFVGTEYVATNQQVVGKLVRPVRDGALVHFWLDFGHVCACLPVRGMRASWTLRPETVEAMRENSKRWGGSEQ